MVTYQDDFFERSCFIDDPNFDLAKDLPLQASQLADTDLRCRYRQDVQQLFGELSRLPSSSSQLMFKFHGDFTMPDEFVVSDLHTRCQACKHNVA